MINFGLGTWSAVPSASGPGMHSDEASSAIPDLEGVASPALIRTLESLSEGVRRNAGQEEKARRDADETIGFNVLIPMARMVTGQWGKPSHSSRDARDRKTEIPTVTEWATQMGGRWSLKSGGRRLPVLRANPDNSVTQGQWVNDPFWDRMRSLREMLAEAEASANRIYDDKQLQKTTPVKRGWVIALRQCRADVEWVLEQEESAVAGEARVVKRNATGDVVSVMGLNASKNIAVMPEKPSRRSRSNPDLEAVPVGERRPWGVVAAKGNMKLPFASYSTLPMASCPGAGSCATNLVRGEKKGYCYSFTAWRYPDAFARQFRNCLAEFADREFAISAGGGHGSVTLDARRPEFAIRGQRARTWHTLVRQIVTRDLSRAVGEGRPAFMRLYVDGDINSEDNVLEWMKVCAELQATRTATHPGIQVYGYSKVWDAFLQADARQISWGSAVNWELSGLRGGGMHWPNNYTLNMSADSVWNDENTQSTSAMRQVTLAMAQLPIARGYFKSIPLSEAIPALAEQVKDGKVVDIKVPAASEVPFPFNEARIKAIVLMNVTMTPVEGDTHDSIKRRYEKLAADHNLLDFVPKTVSPYEKPKDGEAKGAKKFMPLDKWSNLLRDKLYRGWFSYLFVNGITGKSVAPDVDYGGFAQTVLQEMALDAKALKDTKVPTPNEFLSKTLAKKMDAAVKKAIKDRASVGKVTEKEIAQIKRRVSRDPRNQMDKFVVDFAKSDRFQGKAIAVALHEVLWSTGLGGSCPLVCGNCYDTPSVPQIGTPEYLNARHRCASRTGFKDRTIHIGRH